MATTYQPRPAALKGMQGPDRVAGLCDTRHFLLQSFDWDKVARQLFELLAERVERYESRGDGLREPFDRIVHRAEIIQLLAGRLRLLEQFRDRLKRLVIRRTVMFDVRQHGPGQSRGTLGRRIATRVGHRRGNLVERLNDWTRIGREIFEHFTHRINSWFVAITLDQVGWQRLWSCAPQWRYRRRRRSGFNFGLGKMLDQIHLF